MYSGLLNTNQSADQKIYEKTCIDIIKDLSSGLAQEQDEVGESFATKNGIDKTVVQIDFDKNIEGLYKKYHNPNIQPEQKNHTTLSRHLDITKIGSYNYSINDALIFVKNLYKEVGDSLYGMLLISGTNGKVFNPLHPLIATELKKDSLDFDLDSKDWTISLFTFKEETVLDNYYYDKKTDFIQEIAGVIAASSKETKTKTTNKNFNADVNKFGEFVLNYESVTVDQNGNEIKLTNGESSDGDYLIPMQIINISGVAYPYYGTVYSKKGLAWNITPMYSSNISHPIGQATGNGMVGGSRICTHSGNSKTIRGVSALNHSNTTSPLNNKILRNGAITFAQKSLISAIEIFTEEKIGNENKVLNMIEFLEEDNTRTKKDYLKYLREKMKEDIARERSEKSKEPILAFNAYNIVDKIENIDLPLRIPDFDPKVKYSTGNTAIMENGLAYVFVSNNEFGFDNDTWIELTPSDMVEIDKKNKKNKEKSSTEDGSVSNDPLENFDPVF